MASFQGKYEIHSALCDGEFQSVRALQVSSGRPVILHHLAPGRTPPHQPDLAALIFRFLRSASVEESRDFLDMGEDEGGIFVVTADVPECLDLRKWLQTVADAHAGEEAVAQAAPDGTPDFKSIEFTRGFTREALRQLLHSPGSDPLPTSPGPQAAQPAVPIPEESPGVMTPPSEVPAAPSEVTDQGSTEFTAFWEKYSPASRAGRPASTTTPPPSPKIPDGPSEVPEGTAEFSSGRSSLSVHDAPTAAMMTLLSQVADRERTPVTLAEAKGTAGQFVDLVLTPSDVMKPPEAPREAEVSKPSPQPVLTPAAQGPATETPRALTELLMEKDKTSQQGAGSVSTPYAGGTQGAEVKSEEKAPRRQIPMGFEVVFQSNKPRSHPTLSGLPDQSGIMAAPAPLPPPPGQEQPVPSTTEAGRPNVAWTVVSPSPQETGSNQARGFPNAPGDHELGVGAESGVASALLPSPARQTRKEKESERPTRLVVAPAVPPAGPAPQAPPGGSVTTGGATPLISAPMPAPPNRAQPGEYTRMIENVKGSAGPLPPVGPPAAPPAAYQPTAIPAAPALAPSRSLNLFVPNSQAAPHRVAPPQLQPAVYVASDKPSRAVAKKRRVWVPILILSSLFLMTVALLVFFAVKH